MDQDSFRQLISSGGSPQASNSQPRDPLFVKTKVTKISTKSTTVNASGHAFQPRKVKKNDGKYRDRAAERRDGEGNDYAQVEAVLEEFEKRTADQDVHAVEEQRQYLGGDSEHSVLVKGLDFALLQQNKAKAATDIDEDESLEQAYNQASSGSTVSKKRTREDIIRELKTKRGQQDTPFTEDPSLNKGKFMPIGFKPIGSTPAEEKGKKKKVKGDGERKKKKRKVEVTAEEKPKVVDAPSVSSPASSVLKQPAPHQKSEEPEPPEDFDIFTGFGEYEGVDVGDDSDGESKRNTMSDQEEETATASLGPGRWFATDEPAQDTVETNKDTRPALKPSTSPAPHLPAEAGEVSDEEPARLVPLSSSAVPSIKDLLAMDDAVGATVKKQKRKNKKKGGDGEGSKKLSAEAKASRDYQRLQSYTQNRGET
ncbi:hypothetical protein D9757_005732 [Collybiopsis confluens]|uniref:RED-like N-terminal domain-containing protein n=1 Tax=Collybiopsis confluens TaxID=2823264 RepID=A0A8H5HPX0_9AGAR|nr:hypothetical protein D9757_005732 [Collybiopsis confluens]